MLTSSCNDGLSQSKHNSIVTQLPGAEAHSQTLAQKLDEAWTKRDSSYEPRTRHVNEDGTPKFTNRLFL